MGRQRHDITPLWLSHHFPEDYDRCVVVGGRHVCRRCVALYPPALLLAVVAGVTGWSAGGVWMALFVVLPLPAVVEFVAEHLGAVRHSPLRQVVVSVLAGIGLGIGFARYLHQPGDLVFWGVVVLYAGVCGLAALSRARRVP
ncbi:MAG: hypothetical protein JJU45_13440 [Acidimicrobiia bacterium]|nr:hypothetical protein [Acidimicrobiia bacterium]